MGIRIILGTFSFMLGAVIASFAGVVAYRVPKKLSIIKPDSYCPACNTSIKWYDNIPIISYLVLRGKCRNCGSRIGIFSLLCELIGGIMFLVTFIIHGKNISDIPEVLVLFALITLGIIMSSIDYEYHELHNSSLFALFIICVLVSVTRFIETGLDIRQFGEITDIRSFDDLFTFISLPAVAFIYERLFSSAMGFIIFAIIMLVSKQLLHREALGDGDMWIVGLAGLSISGIHLLLGVLFGSVTGSIIELIRVKKKSTGGATEVAFGPYLLMGIIFMIVCGDVIENAYWEAIL